MPAILTTAKSVLTGLELLSAIKKATKGDQDSQLALAKQGIDIGALWTYF